MANLTYGVIKGEADFNTYCLKRWKTRAQFCESFAHNIDGVFIERIYAKSPTDKYHQQYFIMSMEAKKDTPWNSVDTIRKKVYEDIRTGAIALLKV